MSTAHAPDPDFGDDFTKQIMASIQAAKIRAAHAAREAYNNPSQSVTDLLRGAANGAMQLPFDAGATLAPAMSMIAPVGASVLQPLADRTQAWLDQSPLGTTSDAGAIGKLLAQVLMPLPGGGNLAGGARRLSVLARDLP